MREILFRGKRVVNGEWVTGFYTCFNEKEHCIYSGYAETDFVDYYPESFTVLPETVGQYTGLTDKNGTKIFEGDVLKCCHEWTGVNYGHIDLDVLFDLPITTDCEMRELFENQKIKSAYGKHTRESGLGQSYHYYRNYVVEYYAPNGRYRVRNGSVFHDITSSFIPNRNAEVIGNIYDNPELLGGGEGG